MKRFLALFLVLLLLLPAGCKKQTTETAAPDTMVEKEETETLEQDVPVVILPQENLSTEERFEENPSVDNKSGQQLSKEEETDNTPNKKDAFDKDEWFVNYSVTATQEYEQAKEFCESTQREMCVLYQIILTDYSEAEYWTVSGNSRVPDEIPTSVKWDTPLEPLPAFAMIPTGKVTENCLKSSEKSPQIWTRVFCFTTRPETKKDLVDEMEKLVSLDYVYKFKVTPLYDILD